MRYPLSDSDNHLPSLPSVSPERRVSPEPTPPPPPPSDADLSIQEQGNSPVHSTPSTPEGQAEAKRVRTDDSDHESDETQPSTSGANARPPVQQSIM